MELMFSVESTDSWFSLVSLSPADFRFWVRGSGTGEEPQRGKNPPPDSNPSSNPEFGIKLDGWSRHKRFSFSRCPFTIQIVRLESRPTAGKKWPCVCLRDAHAASRR